MSFLNGWQDFVFEIAGEFFKNCSVGHCNFKHAIAETFDMAFGGNSFCDGLFPDVFQYLIGRLFSNASFANEITEQISQASRFS